MEKDELFELLISWLTLSVAFAWDLNPYKFIHLFLMTSIAVGTAFIFHEMAHRYVARRFGYPARFIMWKEGLLFALLLAVLTNGRFVFAAPGAVYVFGHPREKENGLISLAGPLTNLIIAYLFLFLAFFTPKAFLPIIMTTAWVNAFIGFFNMWPIFPLDGSKVLPWNPVVYSLVLLAFLPLLFVFPFM